MDRILNPFNIYWTSILFQALREKAQSSLKSAADEHWSDGALEVPCCIPIFLILVTLDACIYDATEACSSKKLKTMLLEKTIPKWPDEDNSSG